MSYANLQPLLAHYKLRRKRRRGWRQKKAVLLPPHNVPAAFGQFKLVRGNKQRTPVTLIRSCLDMHRFFCFLRFPSTHLSRHPFFPCSIKTAVLAWILHFRSKQALWSSNNPLSKTILARQSAIYGYTQLVQIANPPLRLLSAFSFQNCIIAQHFLIKKSNREAGDLFLRLTEGKRICHLFTVHPPFSILSHSSVQR